MQVMSFFIQDFFGHRRFGHIWLPLIFANYKSDIAIFLFVSFTISGFVNSIFTIDGCTFTEFSDATSAIGLFSFRVLMVRAFYIGIFSTVEV